MSQCTVVVPLHPLTTAKIVPAFSMALHGRFFVELNALCFILLDSVTLVICKSKVE